MSVAFDTLKFAEKLEAGGFSPQQARAAAQAFASATGEQLATKDDLLKLETATRADIAKLEAATKIEIASVKVELRAEIAAVRSEIKSSAAETKTDILRWLVVTQVALAGFIFAAMKLSH